MPAENGASLFPSFIPPNRLVHRRRKTLEMSLTVTEEEASTTGRPLPSLTLTSIPLQSDLVPTAASISLKHGISESIEMVELGARKTTGSPEVLGPTPPSMTSEMRRKANIQFATLCLTLFLGGWMGGTTGPLLPRIQQVYDVSRSTEWFYVIVLIASLLRSVLRWSHCSSCSTVWYMSCRVPCGYAHDPIQGSILASVVNVYLSDKIGFGWVRSCSCIKAAEAHSKICTDHGHRCCRSGHWLRYKRPCTTVPRSRVRVFHYWVRCGPSGKL